jgi:hypothetical protein
VLLAADNTDNTVLLSHRQQGRHGFWIPVLKATWKSLRTTNALENLDREFRRRTKTQGSFGTEAAAITSLHGLVALGQIVLRRIDGHEQLPTFLAKEWFLTA